MCAGSSKGSVIQNEFAQRSQSSAAKPGLDPVPRSARMPDESARRAALRAMLASGSGRGQATLLTGPSGVDPAQLNLGKTMLTGA